MPLWQILSETAISFLARCYRIVSWRSLTPVFLVWMKDLAVELVEPEAGLMEGDIISVIFKGIHYEIEVMAHGFEWLVHTTKLYQVGAHIGIQVIPFNIQIMNKPESSDEKAVEIDV